jgi:hypothetical protein
MNDSKTYIVAVDPYRKDDQQDPEISILVVSRFEGKHPSYVVEYSTSFPPEDYEEQMKRIIAYYNPDLFLKEIDSSTLKPKT